ncbi:hypothetical protein CKO22_19130, partial [Thiococcus pfennigii]|nr:hypothetical protein [Thiococcus pfennigii]
MTLCVDVAAAAELTARLDREQITDDETVGLSLVLAGDVGGMPDLSPLAADFDIIDQSHTSRVAFVNGQTSASQEWRLEIAPRRTGLLTVPSLTLGSLATEPLTLTVLEAATASAPSGDQSVRLEVTATPEAPYVQGRVDYVVRLLARVDVDLLQPRLSEPEAEGARIERVGEDRQYSETIGGERYTVIERRYAVFPQRSGPLEIDPPHLVAAVPVERTPPAQGFGQDPFGPIEEFFGAMPGAGRLRAESVELSDEWQPEGTRVAVGEAITRTVTITAAGVTSAQLPDLALEAPPSVRLYPDPPQGRDEQGGEVPVALKQTKVALVATEPGQVTLPEIRLPWWDTTSDVPREAIIPARTLEVVASAGGGHSAPSPGPAGAAAPSAGASATGGRSLAAAVPAGVWPGLAAVLA